MSKPRIVLPGEFHLITRRTTQQLFLMRPDEETNNAFLYCLAVAAQLFGIDVLLTYAASNHHHTVIFDPLGVFPEFVQHFHKLFARSQNALRGRCENMWSSAQPSAVRLLDRAAVIKELIYTASNPVKDHLVERVHHWPGVNTYNQFMSGQSITVRRPRHFFRAEGPMPESITIEMTIPPELGAREDVIAEVRAGVEGVEAEHAEARKRTGARIVGRKQILAQSWKAAPTTVAPRRGLRPLFAGTEQNRILAIAQYHDFLERYRVARREWKERRQARFPIGTYWLARFAGVELDAN